MYTKIAKDIVVGRIIFFHPKFGEIFFIFFYNYEIMEIIVCFSCLNLKLFAYNSTQEL